MGEQRRPGVRRSEQVENGCAISGCGALLFILVAIVAIIPFGASCSPATVGPDGDGQAEFQASIVDDRKKLFSGELTYGTDVVAKVGDSFAYEVELTAIGENESSTWPPDHAQATPWPPPQRRNFQVGGVQSASLSSGSSSVKIESLSDAQTKQVIAEPGDMARWAWRISINEPGVYELLLTVVTYQGNSDRALAVLTPPITVSLHVEDTMSHRFESMKGFLAAFGVVVGGAITALLGAFAFRTQLIEFTREKRAQWQERRRGPQDDSRDGFL
ncbi:hypothetical protein ACIBVL_13675 [Streptomyces sp. NPDC049687]|uniref:hypothetical protein n=1 Tax=Streptomyces sp. NPDC049687 TaxID=3365596 RepID=UPI0037BD7AD6